VRSIRLIAALLALTAGASACTKVGTAGPTAAGNPWTHHGRLVFATAADPKNLDPVLASSQPTLELSLFIFSWAVRYDEKAQPHPDALREIPTLANGDVSKDGLTLLYKLRPHMKWHDGQPVTCRDLRFTWHVVINPSNNVDTTDGYKDIASIGCSDPLVAVIHMKKIYAPFLQQLFGPNGNAPILPEHLLAKYNDDKGSFNTAPYQSAPIGSGPFRFVSWERGQQVRLAAFDDFYLGKPKLREVIYKILPDENTMLAQMQTHEIDLAFNLRAKQYPDYHKIPGLTLVTVPVYDYDHLDFNLRRPLFADDLPLRRALAYAIDRKAMLDETRRGIGDLAPADESPVIGKAFDSSVMTYPYDPAKARALLDADGWKPGPGGVRVRNGQKLAFAVSTQNESTNGQEIETIVQHYWSQIGADVVTKNAQTSLFFDNTANGILQGGRYDVALFAWSASVDPDDSSIYSSMNFAPHGQNSLFWNDPRATAAMNDALTTINWERRKRDYYVVQEELASQVPTIVLWFRHEVVAYNSDLQGFTPSPVIAIFWDPWEYSI
jgi:peptide/nickel transport system substrate-binding protein